jgi:hypothetical protein
MVMWDELRNTTTGDGGTPGREGGDTASRVEE